MGKKVRNLFVAAVCGLAALHGPLALAQEAQTQRAPTPYVIDLSGSAVPAGNFDNIAFAIHLGVPLRRVAVEPGEAATDLIASYDFADCSKGQEKLLEHPLRTLGPGDASWIDYVDIELLPLPQRGLQWSGGVCYGTRAPGGQWRWHLASTPLAYDPAIDRVRARLWIKDGPITALKLVFDAAVPRQFAQKVVVMAFRPSGEGVAK